VPLVLSSFSFFFTPHASVGNRVPSSTLSSFYILTYALQVDVLHFLIYFGLNQLTVTLAKEQALHKCALLLELHSEAFDACSIDVLFFNHI